MNLYRIWCRFEPDHINAPAGRRGQWRVTRQLRLHVQCARDVIVQYMPDRLLGIVSTKPYPKGSIIRPHKELRRVQIERSSA